MHTARFARDALAARAQDVTQIPVDLDRILRGFVDHLDPAFHVFRRVRLGEQIAGLHDGFQGVAEFVCQGAKFFGRFGGNVARAVGHRLKVAGIV
jgi:hypothetical protein